MLDNILGDLQSNSEENKEKLKQAVLIGEAGNGHVVIKANGLREIQNVEIQLDKMDTSDNSQVEDLVHIALDDLMKKITQIEKEASEQMMNDMLPPGLDHLKNLFT